MGSIPIWSASSSMAHSNAKLPTASPGARIKRLLGISISATCTSSFILPAAYKFRVIVMTASGNGF
jgi:hypothetical protein